MKPTKEQLADPSWWDAHSDNAKYCYRDRLFSCIVFRSTEYFGRNYELLAKRPEPDAEKWKPEEGEWCEARTSGKWRKVKTLNVDLGNDLMAFYVPVTENGLSRLIWCDNYRPIKTQREELIDIVASDMFPNEMAEAILARFDLTEKDGE